MKVTREQRAENRRRIVEAAAHLFREHGPDGVNVAGITKAAGLTHGGFYGHFESKEALLAEALEGALTAQAQMLSAMGGPTALGEYLEGYLSEDHLNNRADGCPVAALGSDIPRQSNEVRAAFGRGLTRFLDAACGSTTTEGKRSEALGSLAEAVGRLIMARAVKEFDPQLARELSSRAKP